MRFERLNENKLKITLTVQDLQEKNINFQDFMANSLENQDLFLDMLEEAEEQVGFSTNNCNVKIEALAMAGGDFIVTITRVERKPEHKSDSLSVTSSQKKKFKVRRKIEKPKSEHIVYKFDCFDDYCYFAEFIAENNFKNIASIAKNIILYSYKNQYYLVLKNINLNYYNILKFNSSITEFATYINDSKLFISKLLECGNIVIKNNALKTSLNHYVKK